MPGKPTDIARRNRSDGIGGRLCTGFRRRDLGPGSPSLASSPPHVSGSLVVRFTSGRRGEAKEPAKAELSCGLGLSCPPSGRGAEVNYVVL